MADLLDIAESVETVTIRGQAVAVPGIDARGIIHILQRFPVIREHMAKKGGVKPERLMEIGGDAVVAIIAAGTGHPGDEKHEEAAGRLGVEEQMDLLEAIFRVTLPKGLDSLLQKLGKLGVLVTGPSAKAPASKSPK